MINNQTILFRVSGGKNPKQQLGSGHIIRCMNLVHSLPSYKKIFLVEDFGDIRQFFKNIDNSIVVSPFQNIQDDVLTTKKLILKHNVKLLIIDKYKVSNNYIESLKPNVKTAVISDLFTIDYSSELVFNGFIGFENQKFTNKFGTLCYLGPKYQILDPKFGNRKIKKNKKIDLLVTFGGFDTKNILSLFLQAYKEAKSNLRVNIISGITNLSTNDQLLIQELRHVKLIQYTKNMKNEMLSSKFGLCSGGLTTYEFASLKIPFAIISQNSHQKITAKEWNRLGMAKNLGMLDKNSKSKIKKFLKDLEIENFQTLNQHHVDGLGAKHVSKILINSLMK